MKAAALSDLRRKIKFTRPQKGVTQISSPSDQVFDLALINTFCGLNGAGKTRLLKRFALEEESHSSADMVIARSDSFPIYLSPAEMVSNSIRKTVQLKAQGGFEELVQAYESFDFNSVLLDRVNYLIHSDYDRVSVFTIESIEGQYAEEASSFQYCIAERKGAVRDTLSLSHGEIYAILLVWMMEAVEGFNVVLLDEPETFLSPLAQTRLSHVLMDCAAGSRHRTIQFLAATHSPYILDAIGYEYSFCVSKIANDLVVERGDRSILNYIGIAPRWAKILLVEDAKAKFVLESILEEMAPGWRHDFLVFSCENGESDLGEVHARVSGIDENKIWLVYDADVVKKGKVFSEVEKAYSFLLPGEDSPEEELITAVNNNISEFLGCFPASNRIKISRALEAVRGLDHHDYFVELARKAGLKEYNVLVGAFQVWFGVNAQACESLVTRLTA
ncbi:AAA family ATPase [Pseudomonas sp. LH21]|uniref:AAA family ATPase n=1 Tax=Pseudomonas sp. LH21 TaxID=3114884 RepID=UPI002F92941F